MHKFSVRLCPLLTHLPRCAVVCSLARNDFEESELIWSCCSQQASGPSIFIERVVVIVNDEDDAHALIAGLSPLVVKVSLTALTLLRHLLLSLVSSLHSS
jgi:hypothetical protein